MNRASGQLNVLVTRPVHQSKRLSHLIDQAGGRAHVVPVIEILPAAHPDEVQRTIGDIREFDLFVFVSTNAVRHGRDYLPLGATLPGTIAAIGPTTAQALERAGFGCDIKPRHGYSSEDLLAEPRMQEVAGQKVVIFRGAGGRKLLGETLEKRGASVTYANVYRRRPPPASARKIRDFLDQGELDLTTATSVETLCNIVDMAGEEHADTLLELTVLTASPRVVKKAAELGFRHDAVLARGPDDKSLVAAMKKWRGGAGQQNTALEDLPENDAMASEKDQDRGSRIHAYQNKVRVGQRDSDTNESTDTPTNADRNEAAEESAPAKTEAQTDDTHKGKETADDAIENTEPAPAAGKPAKSGRALAALALLVALGAVAVGGYNWWRAQDIRSSVETLGAGIPDGDAILADAREATQRVADEITRGVESRLANVDLSAVEDLRAGQDRLDSSLRGQQRGLATLTERLSGLEQDLSAMQGVSASVRNTWVRAEAEYFLQTANSRLQLANDVESALQALRAADERIGALGDPGLTPVRMLLVEEILSVEAMPSPDIQGMALVLNGMTSRVSELPFKARGPGNFAVERAGDRDTPNGWQRAKESVAEVFTSVVRVSPSDGTKTALLAPQETWFLARNLELQLQVARLALMQKDAENFRGSLQTARQWLGDHYEPENQAVRSMLARLGEMEQIDINPTVPDISASLRLLRQIVASSGASQ